jgi:hypothetical protein
MYASAALTGILFQIDDVRPSLVNALTETMLDRIADFTAPPKIELESLSHESQQSRSRRLMVRDEFVQALVNSHQISWSADEPRPLIMKDGNLGAVNYWLKDDTYSKIRSPTLLEMDMSEKPKGAAR